jgi:hypothetical protein
MYCTYNVTLGRVLATNLAAIPNTYSESMFVALGIQHAMRMRHVVICGLLGCTVVFYIISQTAKFSKKMSLNTKCVF